MCGKVPTAIHGSKLAGHKPALVRPLSYRLWLHGFHFRAGWSPDGWKYRWGRCRHNCLHPCRQMFPQAWSIQHQAEVQYLLQHMLPLLHPAARFTACFRACCIGCIRYQSRKEATVMQNNRGHTLLTLKKHIFLLKLGSGSLDCHVVHCSPFCFAGSRVLSIGVQLLRIHLCCLAIPLPYKTLLLNNKKRQNATSQSACKFTPRLEQERMSCFWQMSHKAPPADGDALQCSGHLRNASA